MSEILFLTVAQAYKGGYKYGLSLKLKDEDDTVLAQVKGGGFDMEGFIFREWALTRFKPELEAQGDPERFIPDNFGFDGVRNALAQLGWNLRKVKATTKLHIYELSFVKEDA